MKIRNGFVSNSSSSSFCIYGTIITAKEAADLVNKLRPGEYSDIYSFVEKAGISSLSYALSACVQDGCKLSFTTHPNDDDAIYIGRAYKTIGLEETGKQFQDKVKKDLKSLGISKEPFTIEEAFIVDKLVIG